MFHVFVFQAGSCNGIVRCLCSCAVRQVGTHCSSTAVQSISIHCMFNDFPLYFPRFFYFCFQAASCIGIVRCLCSCAVRSYHLFFLSQQVKPLYVQRFCIACSTIICFLFPAGSCIPVSSDVFALAPDARSASSSVFALARPASVRMRHRLQWQV